MKINIKVSKTLNSLSETSPKYEQTVLFSPLDWTEINHQQIMPSNYSRKHKTFFMSLSDVGENEVEPKAIPN